MENTSNSALLGNANRTIQNNERNEELAQAEIGVSSAIFILAVFGNSTVFLVFLLRRRSLTRMHLLMLHLSAADLSVAFFNVLPQLIWDVTYVFYGNDVICRFVKYFQLVVVYASAYVLVMTAIDRYFAICRPLVSHQWSSRTVHYMVAIAWIISLILSLPQIYIFSYMERTPEVFDCWATFDPSWTLELYITFNSVTVYVIPIIILTFCYGRMCYAVWKRGRVGEQIVSSTNIQWNHTDMSEKAKNNQGNDQVGKGDLHGSYQYRKGGSSDGHSRHGQPRGAIPRAKVRTVRLTLTVVFCFFVCSSPFHFAQLWAAFDPYAPFTSK
ncbi:cephalotocin receptor 1-like [Mizuhopecten yessoensis]|uniref:Cephalotocin receptor 1 n=1 Tax=Mizuhopecten yessoensis TaxID=6573 RepID=A0A210PH80_MIZYE|nr:cephalotocin receptor 1-like [Mizuhopecten yessoensis]OWF35858.1 Cephalotocin receptor 1 [Mizuhopecten yessoensis]OWF36878.1 Cephalotocin receptor 1 [Mizuhopecten yessoensis]